MSLRKRASVLLGAAIVSLSLIMALAPAGAASATAKPAKFDGLTYFRQHGYLPIHGLATLQRAKAYAASLVANHQLSAPAAGRTGAAPTIGANWSGVTNSTSVAWPVPVAEPVASPTAPGSLTPDPVVGPRTRSTWAPSTTVSACGSPEP